MNFDLPVLHDTRQGDVDTYTHQSGRVGRCGRKGICLNLVTPWELERLQQIEAALQVQMKELLDAGQLQL